LERLAIDAREDGRTALLEHEGLEILDALGWRTPLTRIVEDPGDEVDLSAFSGPRVVVKLLSPDWVHRTDIGGVRVIERTAAAVTAALADVGRLDPDGRLLLQQWVRHSDEPGAELLIGTRWTEDLGAVVTLGLGGVATEALAAMMPEHGTLIFSPETHTQADVQRILDESPLGRLATGKIRGQGGRASPAYLARLIDDFLTLARMALPHHLTEFEVNPLVFRGGEAVALDALARIGPGGAPTPPGTDLAPWRKDRIDRLLHPRSVAVVGVSSRMNPGRAMLRNILAAGFSSSAIRVVKPDTAEVDGCACVPSVEDLRPPVDLLAVSVGADDVPPLLTRVVSGEHAGGVVLVSGGLGDGGVGSEQVDGIRDLLAGAGTSAPVVNGGNCLGIRSLRGKCDTLFIPGEKLGFPSAPEHPVALLSQSGAFAIARASALPWLNPQYVVTVGNQIDLTVGEYLEHLADDPAIRVFACYVEGFRPLDGARFLRVARRLAVQGRAVVLYRAGRSTAGAEAAISHTASVAGDYAVTRSLAGAAGVLVAESLAEFEHLLTLATLLDGRSVTGSRLGAVSNAGFECVALADGAAPLVAAEMSGPTTERLGGLLGRHRLEGVVKPRNPLDVTPILGDGAFAEAAGAVIGDPGVDVGVVGCVPLTPALQTLEAHHGPTEDVHRDDGVLAGLRRVWGETRKAWIAVVDGGPRFDALAAGLESDGIPVFRHADEGVRALARYVTWRLRHRVS
jgi:acyl-CoA synthetase (NDP forming)